MRLRFTKMQGAGNDFVMLDGVGQRLDLTPQRLRRLADRHFGIGADQVLVVEPSPDAGADFVYRIFNADGGEVEQCGNGARCFVKFVHALGLTRARSIRVRTAGGLIEPRLEDDGEVSVDMGLPDFDPAASGFDAGGIAARRLGAALLWPIAAGAPDRAPVEVCVVSIGNPHAVQLVPDVQAAPVASAGPALERHARFAHGVNAGFLQVVDRSSIRLRVWERGAGETLACGSGACAAAVAGVRMGLLDAPVRVQARGGTLRIDWQDRPGAHVRMSGPAEKVYDGEIDIP
jgi:diaminopimelate epimerase